MADINFITQRLSLELKKYGTSELTYSKSLFSGQGAEKADISGAINGKKFRVIMFDSSEEMGLPSVSAHFTLNLNDSGLSTGHIEFWNSDNRFTKIYRQHDDVLLVMDTFLNNVEGGDILHSVARIWDIAVKEIPKFKASYERQVAVRRLMSGE